MAEVHGKNSYLSLNAVDISPWVDTGELQRRISTAQTNTFGDANEEHIQGVMGATIPFSGKWDPASSAIDETLNTAFTNSGAVAWIFGPAGSTGGYVKYSGNCIVTDYSISSSVGDKVTVSGTLIVTGAVTRGTF